MNTKLHAVSDANGRPISFFLTAGPVSDYTGAAALLDSLPNAQWMLADRGYDADWFRDALQGRSEEHTSELQSLMRISYAVFCLKKKKSLHLNTMTPRDR